MFFIDRNDWHGVTLARLVSLDQWADGSDHDRPVISCPIGFGQGKESGLSCRQMRLKSWAPLAMMLLCSTARAETPCSGSASGLGCFDAVPGSGPAEPSPFRWFGRGTVVDATAVASTMVLRYSDSPSELMMSSSDPAGRVVPVVRRTTRLEFRLAAGLGRGIDLGLNAPVALGQSGSGPDAILTQAPKPLDGGAFGDPRLTFRIELPKALPDLAWTTRLELTLPFGNERAYIGERTVTGAIVVNGYVALNHFSLVADLGVRVAPITRFGDVNLGSHGIVGVGLGCRPFATDALHLALEGMFRPMLVGAPRPPDAIAQPSWVVPAEWMLSASSRPWDLDLWFSLGAGTALPLSHRDGSSSRVATWFIAPTTSRWQALASVAIRN